jgi:Tol biopolymer transport system component
VKSVKPHERLAIGILAALALATAGLLVFGEQAGLRAPELLNEDGTIGMRGPVTLVFPVLMDQASVESRVGIEPALNGEFRWAGKRLNFFPAEALQNGRTYTLRLDAGAEGQNGRMLRNPAGFSFKVREPEVLYLSPISGGPELWRAAADGSSRRVLTESGGMVFDYAADRGGRQVAVSVLNAQNGADLWLYPRDDAKGTLLVDCKAERCTQPAWSPEGSVLAYTRQGRLVLSGAPQTWVLNIESGESNALFPDQQASGSSPLWSPDGRRLAVVDGRSGGIRVYDMESGRYVLLESNQGLPGSWSADSKRLMFTNLQVSSAALPFVSVYIMDFEAGEIVPAFGGELEAVNYSQPAWSWDGGWIAVGLQAAVGGGSKQIWTMRLDGSDALEVTSDPAYTHAAYQWGPDGKALVYQRFSLTTSFALPEVAVWDAQTEQARILAEDAALPAWLP